MILRPATAADAPDIADINEAARILALPDVRWAHSVADMRDWVANMLLPAGGVHVAERDGKILGFIALHEDWVEQLYLRPGHWRQGIGTPLLEGAKSRSPGGLRLWCFQCNTRARAFYEAHGFVAERFTDGADNEEHEPDILYAWRGRDDP